MCTNRTPEEIFELKRKNFIKWIMKLPFEKCLYQYDKHSCGCSDAFIIVADWNEHREEDDIISSYSTKYQIHPRFEDQIEICSSCGVAGDVSSMRTNFVYTESDALCRECFSLEENLDFFLNEAKLIYRRYEKDLQKLGFKKFDQIFETGFHEGQNDDPEKALKNVQHEYPNRDFVFVEDDITPFYVSYVIYWRKR